MSAVAPGITTSEIAEEVGVTVETVRRWVREGRLRDPRESTGNTRVMLFEPPDVDRALELAAETAEGPMPRLLVSVPSELRDRLRALAEAQGRSLSALCRQALWLYLETHTAAHERAEFGVPEPYDIRGTEEEHSRIAAVYTEAPYLRAVMP